MNVVVVSDKFDEVLGVAEDTPDSIVNVLINAGKVDQFTRIISHELAPRYPHITTLENIPDWEKWLRHQSVITLERIFYEFKFDTFKLIKDYDKRY